MQGPIHGVRRPLRSRARDYTAASLHPASTSAPPGAPVSEAALSPYLRAIRGHKLLVVLVTLAAVAGSLLWLTLRTPTYEATAELLVTPLPQDDRTFLGLQLLRDSGDPTRTVQTAANLVKSPQAAQITARALGSDWSTRRVLGAVQVEPQGQSNILAITAGADSAKLATRIANEFMSAALEVRARALRRQVTPLLSSLRARAARSGSEGEAAAEMADRINQLETIRNGTDPTLSRSQLAEVPRSPAGAGPVIVIALALMGGLALGAGSSVLLELLDRRVRDQDEAIALYPLPILARVPILPRRLRRPPGETSWLMPPSVREAFRTVLIQLERSDGAGGHVVMVTSASTGDGKTTSAINLAVSLAAAGESVMLLDVDLRKPDVGTQLGVSESTRLIELVKPEAKLEELAKAAPHLPSLSVLSTGAAEEDAALIEALNRRLPELLSQARSLADTVVLDTAPLGEVSDALRIADSVDDIIVVMRPGNTDRANLETMRDLLERTGWTPRGYVVIGEPHAAPTGYYGYGLSQRELVLSKPPPERPPAR